MPMNDEHSTRGDDTRERIKLAARRLFAQRGFADVTVRDIVDAAGQKNGGSLHYYFGTKEALIRELVLDGSQAINDERTRRLDAIEAAGGPTGLRDIVHLVVDPVIGATPKDEFSVSFAVRLTVDHYDMLLESMESRRRDSSYRRCVEHIHRFVPALPRRLLDQRIKLMTLYVLAAVSSREGAEGGRNDWAELWADPAAIANLIDTVEGLLSQPPSPDTLRLTKRTDKKP